MGYWKRCSKCGGKVEVLVVMKTNGKVDKEREGWKCRDCEHMVVVSKAKKGGSDGKA